MHGNTCSCGPSGMGKGQICGWCKGPMGSGHNKLCTLWTLAVVTFLLGAIAWVGALVTDMNATTWMGMTPGSLYHNAAILFILSVMFKMKKHWLMRALMAKKWMGCDCGAGCGCEAGGGCSSGCGCESSGGCGTGGCCGGAGCGEGEAGCGKEGCCKA